MDFAQVRRQKTVHAGSGARSRRASTELMLLALATALFVCLPLLAGRTAAQKQNQKDKKQDADASGITSPIPPPDGQAIDMVVSQMLGAWQVGDVEMMHKAYADDVTVVSGSWEPPLMGWANYARAYQAQRARTQSDRLERSKHLHQGKRRYGLVHVPVAIYRAGGWHTCHGVWPHDSGPREARRELADRAQRYLGYTLLDAGTRAFGRSTESTVNRPTELRPWGIKLHNCSRSRSAARCGPKSSSALGKSKLHAEASSRRPLASERAKMGRESWVTFATIARCSAAMWSSALVIKI